jgi:hypothetical protein
MSEHLIAVQMVAVFFILFGCAVGLMALVDTYVRIMELLED